MIFDKFRYFYAVWFIQTFSDKGIINNIRKQEITQDYKHKIILEVHISFYYFIQEIIICLLTIFVCCFVGTYDNKIILLYIEIYGMCQRVE